MDGAASPLKIFHGEPEPAVGSNPETRLIVEEVLRHLRGEHTPASESPYLGPRLADPPDQKDARTTSPGVNQIATLRQVYDDLYNRAKNDKAESSWSGYRTLLRYWERSHGCSGPCVTAINEDVLQTFFESVPEWHSERSWQRNRDLLFALLKSCCVESPDNVFGRKKDQAILSRDDLPLWRLPKARWFRDRPKTDVKGKQKRGGHRKRKIPLLKVEEFGRVLKACDDVEFMDPLWWKTWLSLLWYNGPRFEDSLKYQWDEGQLHFDLQNRLLDFTETKCGGNSGIPMPSWLADLLTELRESQAEGASGDFVFALGPGEKWSRHQTPDFRLTRGDLSNRHRRLDPEYVAIWKRAGVPVRHPHELRSVAITYWSQHAPEYRFAATGHAPPKGDTQLRSYVILDDKFYQAAETFPYPDSV